MKKLILAAVTLCTTSTFACGNLPQKVDDNYLYAEVISRSQMDLGLAVVLKTSALMDVKFLGGRSVDSRNMPSCDSEKEADVKWLNSRIATQSVSGIGNNFRAGYKICVTNYRGELVREYEICNSEVGD